MARKADDNQGPWVVSQLPPADLVGRSLADVGSAGQFDDDERPVSALCGALAGKMGALT
jgi:hypothetical protein